MTGRPVKLVDNAGRVHFEGTDQAPGGGSQPVKIVRVPLAFDTPALAAQDGGASAGVVAYTPTPGDALIWSNSYFSIPTTAFAGDSGVPTFNLTWSDLSSEFYGQGLDGALDAADLSTGDHLLLPALNSGTNFISTAVPSIFPDATPLRVVIDDGSTGDPAMTQGEGELVLFIIAAAA